MPLKIWKEAMFLRKLLASVSMCVSAEGDLVKYLPELRESNLVCYSTRLLTETPPYKCVMWRRFGHVVLKKEWVHKTL